MLQKINRIIDIIISFMTFLAGLLVFFSMFSIAANVFSRFVLGKPLVWVIEMNEYSLLYITFLVAAWVLKEESHVKVDIVLSYLSNRTKALLGILNSIVGFLISVIFTIYGTLVTIDLFIRGVYNPTILSFPKGPLLAIIPISFFFLTLQFVRRAYAFLVEYRTNFKVGKSFYNDYLSSND